MAVRALAAHHHRDSQTGMVQHIFLQGIVGFPGKTGRDARVLIFIRPGICPVKTVQNAQAPHFFHFLAELLGKGNVLAVSFINTETVEPLVQLAYLFPQCHFFQKILCSFSGREGRVLIFFHASPLSALQALHMMVSSYPFFKNMSTRNFFSFILLFFRQQNVMIFSCIGCFLTFSFCSPEHFQK